MIGESEKVEHLEGTVGDVRETTLGGKVQRVVLCDDGSGHLVFGGSPGLPDGRVLYFDASPPGVLSLEGRSLKVLDNGDVTLEGVKVAERESLTKIKFTAERFG